MISLYVNNFRGFENTFVHFQDVNFFLGENSTGKTSILKLIKILSEPNFRISYDLGNEFSEIGNYYDIVYKGSSETHFEVGYEKDGTFIKIAFEPKNNRPVIHRLYAKIESIDVELYFENSQVSVKRMSNSSPNEGIKLSFSGWITQTQNKNSNVNDERVIASHYYERLPLSTVILMHINELFKEKMNNSFRNNIFTSIIRAFDSTLLPKVTCIDPIRAEPKRLYDEYSSTYNSAGSHAPYLLKQILTSGSGQNTFKIKEFLKYGQASGLFTEVIPKIFDKKDDSSPFELLISIGGKSIKLNHVGYGVSQVLPLIVEIMNGEKDSWIAIQQPEVHLHPRAQAAFGDFVFAFSERDDKKFIIETHSDFLIDRFRLALSKSRSRRNSKVQAQVCFFERTSFGNSISHVTIEKNGLFGEEQPPTFRDFFLKEQLDLLSM